MTRDGFRRLALSQPEAVESAHMNHPDFRVRGRIFATLGYPDDAWGMVKLSPIDQELFIQADPETFSPVKGAWGKGGATRVQLRTARKALLARAFDCARRATLAAQQARRPARRTSKKSS
jgi:YjbR